MADFPVAFDFATTKSNNQTGALGLIALYCLFIFFQRKPDLLCEAAHRGIEKPISKRAIASVSARSPLAIRGLLEARTTSQLGDARSLRLLCWGVRRSIAGRSLRRKPCL
jgi:hypothetical protein